jgi:hypothetical protein
MRVRAVDIALIVFTLTFAYSVSRLFYILSGL